MSLINLGLQSVGVLRQQMSDEMEKAISNANSMDEIQKVADRIPEVKQHFMESLKPAKQLLADTLSRLT